jgi:O-acetyl-ADP-ribose deacetylase (regulator of RNase III)
VISEVCGDILDADTEAIVNPVNTVGVMGTGLALQFKRKYPKMFREYLSACRRGELKVGRVLVHSVRGYPRLVVNFPTKRDWRDPSQLEWIEWGLADLQALIGELTIRSIAIPPLGCGHGGLGWSDVRKLIEQRLGDMDVDVVLYVSSGDPS